MLLDCTKFLTLTRELVLSFPVKTLFSNSQISEIHLQRKRVFVAGETFSLVGFVSSFGAGAFSVLFLTQCSVLL